MRSKRSRPKPKACVTRKRRYRTEFEAQQGLAAIRKSQNVGPEGYTPIRTYECQFCNGGWHLTHKENNRGNT